MQENSILITGLIKFNIIKWKKYHDSLIPSYGECKVRRTWCVVKIYSEGNGGNKWKHVYFDQWYSYGSCREKGGKQRRDREHRESRLEKANAEGWLAWPIDQHWWFLRYPYVIVGPARNMPRHREDSLGRCPFTICG